MATLSGGDKLEAYLANMAKSVEHPATLEVGFLAGATYPDGTSVPMVAALNEYGVPEHNQPPRPFFRGMIAAKSPTWGEDVAVLLKSTDMDAEAALMLMGEHVSGQLAVAITDFTSPGNAPSTIARKKFENSNRPLIDTGHMRNSIMYKLQGFDAGSLFK